MDSNLSDEILEIGRPPFQRKLLPPRLYSAPDGKYSVGVNSVTVFSLEPKENSNPSSQEDEEEAEEISLPDAVPGTSSGSMVTPVAFWASGSNGSVPEQAVRVGSDLDGGPLYVGRAFALDNLLPGKVAKQHFVCYVAYDGKEMAFREYEVLVLSRGRVEWVPCKNGAFPAHALPAGLTLQGVRVYSVRASVNGIVTPGMLISGESQCRISYDMKEFTLSEYEVLTVQCLNPSEFGGAVRHVPREDAKRPDPTKPTHRMLYDHEDINYNYLDLQGN